MTFKEIHDRVSAIQIGVSEMGIVNADTAALRDCLLALVEECERQTTEIWRDKADSILKDGPLKDGPWHPFKE